jgi:hypothetical protein
MPLHVTYIDRVLFLVFAGTGRWLEQIFLLLLSRHFCAESADHNDRQD